MKITLFVGVSLALLLVCGRRARALPATPGGSIPATSQFSGVTFGNGLFVAVGWRNLNYPYDPVVLTSPDAFNWADRSMEWTNHAYLTDVCFGNGIFVAVGGVLSGQYDALVVRSTNGTDWIAQAAATETVLNAVAWGNDLFVAVGPNGILTSRDGRTWTSQGWAFENLTSVAYGNGKFVAGGYAAGTVLVSTNGVVWTPYHSATANPFLELTRGNGIFVGLAAPYAGSYSTEFMVSPDGINWLNRSQETNTSLRGLAFGNRLFVGLRQDGLVQVSANAAIWDFWHAGSASLNDAAYGNDRFVAVGGNGAIVTSQNGSIWTDVRQPLGPASILSHPASQSVPAGGNVLFSVAVSGNPAPSCKWQRDGMALPAPPVPVLRLTSVGPEAAGGYSAVVGNALGSVTSAVATLTVTVQAPVFNVQPSNRTALVGEWVCFSAHASGAPVPDYQWQHDGTNLPGATGPSLCLTNVGLDQSGDYAVVASNLAGATNSVVATLTLSYQPPAFSSEPLDRTALAGETVAFSGSARSGPPPSYQWQFQGIDILDATNSVLTIYNASPSHAGGYALVASNFLGSVTSRVASLAVTVIPPSFAGAPASVAAAEGSQVTFVAPATGAPPPILSLQFNGTSLAVPYRYDGFTLLEVTPRDAGDYAIVASNYVGVATSMVARLTVVPGGPLDRWTRRNPRPQGNELRSVAFGQGTFVAVGERGAIVTSPDGTNWTSQSLRTDASLNGVAFGDGRFVAVGEDGNILSSADGANWTLRLSAQPSPSPSFGFASVAYGNGRFVAVAYSYFHPNPSGRAWTSADGITWVQNPLSTFTDWRHVTFGNGLFVAIDADQQGVWTSPDGLQWAKQAWVGYRELESLTFGNGRFVGVGNDGLVMVSPDATNWTAQSAATFRRFLDVAFANGRFLAVGTRGTMFSSADGTTWTAEDSGTPDRLHSVTWADGRFVSVGENGTTLTSGNGRDWSRQNLGTTRDLDGMTVGNGMLVIVGKRGTILTSSDGVRYAEQPSGTTNNLHGVAFADGLFVAVGDPGVILTSPDGTQWTPWASGTHSSLKRVVYGNGNWIAVGTQGTILGSADGIVWTPRGAGTADDLNDVAYGNGRFVVVGDDVPPNGTLLFSFDGVTWMSRPQATGKNLRAVTFANGMFLAVGNDGTMRVSTDGLTWSARDSGISRDGDNLRAATWNNGTWLVVGNHGIILTSTNASQWTRRPARTLENLHGAEYLNGTFVTIGNRGTILQSARVIGAVLTVQTYHPAIGFQIAIEGEIGRQHRLQASTDLRRWADLFTFNNTQLRTFFVDQDARFYSHRFYRVVSP